MNAFKCSHCGNEIDSFDIHEIYVADFSSINEINDLYSGYHKYFEQTTFHCPDCGARLSEDEIMEYCSRQFDDDDDCDED